MESNVFLCFLSWRAYGCKNIVRYFITPAQRNIRIQNVGDYVEKGMPIISMFFWECPIIPYWQDLKNCMEKILRVDILSSHWCSRTVLDRWRTKTPIIRLLILWFNVSVKLIQHNKNNTSIHIVHEYTIHIFTLNDYKENICSFKAVINLL